MAETEQGVSAEVEELGVTTAKKSIVYVGGDVISSVLTVLMLIFLARYLQPSLFGIYSIVIAFSTLLNVGSNFGIGTAFRKMLPELKITDSERLHRLLSNGYFIALCLGLVIAVIGVLISGLLAVDVYGNAAMTLPLQLAAVAEFLAVVYNLTLAALTGLGMVKYATFSNVTYGASGLFFTVALVLLGYGVLGALIGYVIGFILSALVGIFYLVRATGFRPKRRDKATVKELSSFSAPVVASYVAQYGAQSFAVLFLGVFVVSSVVGNYGSAYKLARIIELLITDATFILLPAFAKALSSESIAHKIGAIYNNSIYYSALVLLPIVAYAISAATPLANVLLGSAYTTAPFYFSVMIIGMTVSIIGAYAGTLIIGHGDTKRFLKYQLIAIIVQLLLVVVLTPYLQAIGVLLALFVITPIILDAIYIVALEEQFKFRHTFGKLIRITIAAVITWMALYGMAIVIGASSKWLLITNAVVALLLFPPLVVLLGGIEKKNLDFIKKTGERLSPAKPFVDAIVRYTAFFVR